MTTGISTVPACLLHPADAQDDGRVEVIVTLRVPVPGNYGMARTLTDMLAAAEVTGVHATPYED